MAHIISHFAEDEIEAFRRLSYTMGGMIIFPANRIDGKSNINGARGFHYLIRDRIDLTLECIKRHYLGEKSPLADVLRRYSDFFSLFGDFRGYVEFFLLQDLVIDDFLNVKFFMPFDEFTTPAVPSSVGTYQAYKDLVMKFVRQRNERILSYIDDKNQPVTSPL